MKAVFDAVSASDVAAVLGVGLVGFAAWKNYRRNVK